MAAPSDVREQHALLLCFESADHWLLQRRGEAAGACLAVSRRNGGASVRGARRWLLRATKK
jgi:hypothetical protein